MRTPSPLVRLVRSLSRRLRELEALLLERLRMREARRRSKTPTSSVTAEDLALLDADPALKASGAAARAKLERMIDEGDVAGRHRQQA